MTTTKQKVRGVDGYDFRMSRSKTVPGAFNVTITKTYRPDSDGDIHEEVLEKKNISFGEVIGFFEESLTKAYF